MEKFGKFELMEKIGEGGMAEIFLARRLDAALSKLVAIKRILPAHSKNKYYREMFRREGEIALGLRHPSIVTVLEAGTVNGLDYIAMEYFPGKTLAQLLRKLQEKGDALEVPDKVYLIQSIADALQYIHDFRDYGDKTEIIHRDISPHNVLIGFDGGAKLIDFGVAKIKSDATNSTDLKGKLAYMSPEQIRGDELTKQTDIFSLGIVCWEILAVRKLFTGKSAEEIARKVEACEIPSLHLPASAAGIFLQRAVRKALNKDIYERYKNAADFAADLEDVLRHFPRNDYPKRISQALQSLYSEDVSRLQAQLKLYETNRRESQVDMPETTTRIELTKTEIVREPVKPSTPTARPTSPEPRPVPPRVPEPPRVPPSSPPPVPQTPASLPDHTTSGPGQVLELVDPVPPRSHPARDPSFRFRLKRSLNEGGRESSDVRQIKARPSQVTSSSLKKWVAGAVIAFLGVCFLGGALIYLAPHEGPNEKKLVTDSTRESASGFGQSQRDPERVVAESRTNGQAVTYAPPPPPPTPFSEPQRAPRLTPRPVVQATPRAELRSVVRPSPSPPPARVESRPKPPAPRPSKVQAKPPHVPTRSSKEKGPRSVKNESKPQIQRKDPRAEAPTPRRPATGRVEKAPEGKSSITAFAYLTVFANAGERIFVDGKEVGTEIADNLKVAADKKVVIKVLAKGRAARVQTLEFNPFSRNVVDMARFERTPTQVPGPTGK